MTSNPMPLADYQAPECKCSHMYRDHLHGAACLVDGCGCTQFRSKEAPDDRRG